MNLYVLRTTSKLAAATGCEFDAAPAKPLKRGVLAKTAKWLQERKGRGAMILGTYGKGNAAKLIFDNGSNVWSKDGRWFCQGKPQASCLAALRKAASFIRPL